MPDVGLLTPGADLGPGAATSGTDDIAVLRAMLRVEAAWLRAQAVHRLLPDDRVELMVAVLSGMAADDATALELATTVARQAADGGNPVIPLLAAIRSELVAVGLPDTGLHAGLTSQDVLDTALVLMLRAVTDAARADLETALDGVAELADRYRTTPALGRTLTQPAVPTTLGARFAGWLQDLRMAHGALLMDTNLPAAFGGAAGTLAGVVALFGPMAEPGRAMGLVNTWAHAQLGVPLAPGPWHVARGPMVRWAHAAAQTCAALGTIAADVLICARPEIGELAEPAATGRGGSSAMAHKHNPVLSVLLRRSALLTPALAAQVLTAAGQSVDQRADGAWHAEWPALQQLARHLAGSTHVAAELLTGLVVDPAAAARNLAIQLGVDPARADVGIAPLIVDQVLLETGYQDRVIGRPLPSRSLPGSTA